ncbi:MAG: ABC transporter permease [Lachnospiraceae bacterium]|nr:ABC transporter permease [Lachnospiraceae bacterium]
MGKYILKRMAYMLIVVWAVSLIAFVLLRLAPSDAATLALPDTATEEQIEAKRIEMGLDAPLIVQYGRYMKNLLRLDLGTSLQYGTPCKDIIMTRLPATCSIALTAAVIILFISIPLGIIAGVNQGSAVDFLCTFIVVLLQSMAVVWVCILLLLIFTVKFNLLPAMGYKGFSAPQYLIMPIIASGYRLMTSLTRMGRSGMIDVLSEDYRL